MQDYICMENYTKRLKGKEVLRDICISVPQGCVVGFVGPNGSGKSMLLRAVAGLIRPTTGRVWVEGKQLGKRVSFPPSVGIVIENVGLWPEYTGLENLRLLANIRKKVGDAQAREALFRVGLDPSDKRTAKKYSLGMKQRLVIAQAIMEKPRLLLLDEPTNALDESGVEQIRGVITEERQRGATILLSSHNSQDISLLCDAVFAMREGEMSRKEVTGQ